MDTTQLRRLIQDRLDAGDSLRDIEARITKAGHTMSYSQIHALHRDTVKKAPTAEHIQALAAGLKVSPVLVRRAVFIGWYGYDPMESDAGFVAAVPADLDDDERAELDRVIQGWLIAKRG